MFTDTKFTQTPPIMKIVKSAKQALTKHYNDQEAINILMKYVNAQDWEVRKIVAESLRFISEENIFCFLGLLTDNNVYVCNAAKSACERKNLFIDEDIKQKMVADSMIKKNNILSKKYGKEIMDWVREETERAYDFTVGTVAHDIRGLLGPMLVYIDSVDKAVKDPIEMQNIPRITKYLHRLKNSTQLIERLTDDMQCLSKKSSENRQTEGIKGLLLSANDMVIDFFNSRNYDISMIKCEIAVDNLLTCKVSQIDIIRAFYNLIKNAYEAYLINEGVFTKGTVLITAKENIDNNVISVIIQDYGMGMSPDELSHYLLFNPGCTSKKVTGTGFGRAIAFRKITDHNGEIKVESQDNVGTTVTVILPKN